MKKNNNIIYSDYYEKFKIYSKEELEELIEELKNQINEEKDFEDISDIENQLSIANTIYKENFDNFSKRNKKIKFALKTAIAILVTASALQNIKNISNHLKEEEACETFLEDNFQIFVNPDFDNYKENWLNKNDSNLKDFEEYYLDIDPIERFDLAYCIYINNKEEIIGIEDFVDLLLYYGFDYDSICETCKNAKIDGDSILRYKKICEEAIKECQNKKENERNSNIIVKTKIKNH